VHLLNINTTDTSSSTTEDTMPTAGKKHIQTFISQSVLKPAISEFPRFP
jgi:hypothetical protein